MLSDRLRDFGRRLLRGANRTPPSPRPPARGQAKATAEADLRPDTGGARDYTGPARLEYSPRTDGHPDPGEVIWCWVPYEENDGRGKDRPVVAMGTALDGSGDLLVVQMSSKQRHATEANWVPIGTGAWDDRRRDSFANVDRPLAVPESAVRREGGLLAPDRFADVAGQLRARYRYE